MVKVTERIVNKIVEASDRLALIMSLDNIKSGCRECGELTLHAPYCKINRSRCGTDYLTMQKIRDSERACSQEETILCPFCKEPDFDLIGLKSHLLKDCEQFDNTENIKRL
jgi:hypothetical protein